MVTLTRSPSHDLGLVTINCRTASPLPQPNIPYPCPSFCLSLPLLWDSHPTLTHPRQYEDHSACDASVFHPPTHIHLSVQPRSHKHSSPPTTPDSVVDINTTPVLNDRHLLGLNLGIRRHSRRAARRQSNPFGFGLSIHTHAPFVRPSRPALHAPSILSQSYTLPSQGRRPPSAPHAPLHGAQPPSAAAALRRPLEPQSLPHAQLGPCRSSCPSRPRRLGIRAPFRVRPRPECPEVLVQPLRRRPGSTLVPALRRLEAVERMTTTRSRLPRPPLTRPTSAPFLCHLSRLACRAWAHSEWSAAAPPRPCSHAHTRTSVRKTHTLPLTEREPLAQTPHPVNPTL